MIKLTKKHVIIGGAVAVLGYLLFRPKDASAATTAPSVETPNVDIPRWLDEWGWYHGELRPPEAPSEHSQEPTGSVEFGSEGIYRDSSGQEQRFQIYEDDEGNVSTARY